MFIFAIADEMNYAFSPPQFIFKVLATITFVGTMTVLIYIASTSTKRKVLFGDLFWKIYSGLVLIGSLIIKYLIDINYLSIHYTPLRIAIGETLRILTGIIIISVYLKLKLAILSKRTIRIKRLWIIVGVILFLQGIIRTLIYGIEFVYEVIIRNEINNVPINNLTNFAEIIGTVSIGIIALLTFAFVLVYPESLLMSNEQILKVAKLYQLIDKAKLDQESLDRYLPFDNKDLIIEYLKSISEKTNLDNETQG